MVDKARRGVVKSRGLHLQQTLASICHGEESAAEHDWKSVTVTSPFCGI